MLTAFVLVKLGDPARERRLADRADLLRVRERSRGGHALCGARGVQELQRDRCNHTQCLMQLPWYELDRGSAGYALETFAYSVGPKTPCEQAICQRPEASPGNQVRSTVSWGYVGTCRGSRRWRWTSGRARRGRFGCRSYGLRKGRRRPCAWCSSAARERGGRRRPRLGRGGSAHSFMDSSSPGSAMHRCSPW